jgi:hypothetical protein
VLDAGHPSRHGGESGALWRIAGHDIGLNLAEQLGEAIDAPLIGEGGEALLKGWERGAFDALARKRPDGVPIETGREAYHLMACGSDVLNDRAECLGKRNAGGTDQRDALPFDLRMCCSQPGKLTRCRLAELIDRVRSRSRSYLTHSPRLPLACVKPPDRRQPDLRPA